MEEQHVLFDVCTTTKRLNHLLSCYLTHRVETDSGKMLPSATTTQDGTETLDDGASASGGGGEDAASSEEPEVPVRPGAYRVYPSNRAPSPETERGATATAIANQSPLDAESQPSVESDHVVVEAYAVEDPEDPPSAVLLIPVLVYLERKRLLALVGTVHVQLQ